MDQDFQQVYLNGLSSTSPQCNNASRLPLEVPESTRAAPAPPMAVGNECLHPEIKAKLLSKLATFFSHLFPVSWMFRLEIQPPTKPRFQADRSATQIICLCHGSSHVAVHHLDGSFPSLLAVSQVLGFWNSVGKCQKYSHQPCAIENNRNQKT